MFLIKYAIGHAFALWVGQPAEAAQIERPATPRPTKIARRELEQPKLKIIKIRTPALPQPSLYIKNEKGILIPLDKFFDDSDLETEDDDWVIGEDIESSETEDDLNLPISSELRTRKVSFESGL